MSQVIDTVAIALKTKTEEIERLVRYGLTPEQAVEQMKLTIVFRTVLCRLVYFLKDR